MIGSDETLNRPYVMYVINPHGLLDMFIEHLDKADVHFIGASLLKFVLFEMYNYLVNFRPVLLGAPLQLGALSARLVRLWVNPALHHRGATPKFLGGPNPSIHLLSPSLLYLLFSSHSLPLTFPSLSLEGGCPLQCN